MWTMGPFKDHFHEMVSQNFPWKCWTGKLALRPMRRPHQKNKEVVPQVENNVSKEQEEERRIRIGYY